MPAPAVRVSVMWASIESEVLVGRTAAMPPWAQEVLVVLISSLVQTMTSPSSAAVMAALRPATPEPRTRVSQKICGRSPVRKGMRYRRVSKRVLKGGSGCG